MGRLGRRDKGRGTRHEGRGIREEGQVFFNGYIN
jgi:hypothetical protein